MDGRGGGVLQSGIPWAALCSHLSRVWQALFHSELAASGSMDLPMQLLHVDTFLFGTEGI